MSTVAVWQETRQAELKTQIDAMHAELVDLDAEIRVFVAENFVTIDNTLVFKTDSITGRSELERQLYDFQTRRSLLLRQWNEVLGEHADLKLRG